MLNSDKIILTPYMRIRDFLIFSLAVFFITLGGQNYGSKVLFTLFK